MEGTRQADLVLIIVGGVLLAGGLGSLFGGAGFSIGAGAAFLVGALYK